jgi:hypothetical protein
MCLKIGNKGARVAKKPIPVYKVLTLDNRSPYYPTRYHGGLNRAVELKWMPEAEGIFSTPYDSPAPMAKGAGLGVTSVGEGFLHAYFQQEEAEKLRDSLTMTKSTACTWYPLSATATMAPVMYKVVEMEIPVGALYYTDDSEKEVATRALMWKNADIPPTGFLPY